MQKAVAVLLVAVFLVLAANMGTVHAENETVLDGIVSFARGIVSYVKELFSARHESAFDASAINNATLSDPSLPPLIVESRSFYSPALGQEKNYTIVLPPHYYENAEKRYPVIYLLHGLWGDERSWIMKGHIVEIYGRLLAAGKAGEVVIAMPDGDNSAYENGCSGYIAFSCGSYADYIVKDFIGEIDSRYRTLPDRQHRAIDGLSLGGRGSMTLAFRNPGLFAFASGHGGSYSDLLETMTDAAWVALKSSNITVYFDHARYDLVPGFLASSRDLDKALADKGIEHEYEEIDFPILDSHNWPFWRQQVAISLEKACRVICPNW